MDILPLIIKFRFKNEEKLTTTALGKKEKGSKKRFKGERANNLILYNFGKRRRVFFATGV